MDEKKYLTLSNIIDVTISDEHKETVDENLCSDNPILIDNKHWKLIICGKYGSEYYENKLNKITALRFFNIDFEDENYSSLYVFKNVKRFEFVNCRAFWSELPRNSAIAKMNKALGNQVTQLHFENSRVVHIRNIKYYTKLESLCLKSVDSIAWEHMSDNTPRKNKLQFSEFPSIKRLELVNVSVNEFIIKNIARIPSIETLILSNIHRGKNAIAIINRLFPGKLKQEKLSEFRLTDMPMEKPPEWLYDLVNLKTLDLSNLRLTTFETPDNAFESLDWLILDGNPIANLNLSKFKKLTKISFANTDITKFPNINKNGMLKELNCSYCRNIQWKSFMNIRESSSKMLENLEVLDISHTEFYDFPNTFECKKLQYLNISDTKITKLPLKECFPNVQYLVAENLHLDDFPEYVLSNRLWRFHETLYSLEQINMWFNGWRSQKNNENKTNKNDNKSKGEHKRAYLRNTRVNKISPHFVTGKPKEARLEFWDYEHDPTGNQATIVFIGAKGEKENAICKLFDITDDDFVHCKGQKIVNVKTQLQVIDTKYLEKIDIESDEECGKILTPDTELTIWSLTEQSKYRSGHGLFMPNNALYVLVLDHENTLEQQRKAIFWFRYINYSVSTADILFLLTKKPDNGINILNFEKLKRNTQCHVHEEIACLDSKEDPEDTLDKARAIMTHAIKRLPSYRGRVIKGWKQTLRHIKEICEISPRLTYTHNNNQPGIYSFDNICHDHIKPKGGKESKISSEMLKTFRMLLVEAGICYDDEKGNLYSLAWLSCFVYATMEHAANKYGGILTRQLQTYLQDNVEQYDYFEHQIKDLLKAFSKPTPEQPQLYFTWQRNEEIYVLPQFSYMREKWVADDEFMLNNEWLKIWRDRPKALSNSKYKNCYVIDMPLLSDTILVDIICRLAYKLKNPQNDGKQFLHTVTDCNKDVAIGADGLMAKFNAKASEGIPDCYLLVDAVPAAPGRLQIIAGTLDEHYTVHPNSNKAVKLLDKLSVIQDYAFHAIFDAVKHNTPMLKNMRTYLVLPNYFLSAPSGAVSWRIPLQDIYYAEKRQAVTFEHIEGSLPMDKMRHFIPERFKKQVDDLLKM